MTQSAFDSLIREKTIENPGTFCDLIFFWDRHEREIPTREELQRWVAELIKAKRISLIEEDRFPNYDPTLPLIPFAGVTGTAYDKALNEYHAIWDDYRKKNP